MQFLKLANEEKENIISQIKEKFSIIYNNITLDYKALTDKYYVVFSDLTSYGSLDWESRRDIVSATEVSTYSDYLQRKIDSGETGTYITVHGLDKVLQESEEKVRSYSFLEEHLSIFLNNIKNIENTMIYSVKENNNYEEILNFLNKAKNEYGEESGVYKYILKNVYKPALSPIDFDVIISNLEKYFSLYFKSNNMFRKDKSKELKFIFKNISDKKIFMLNTGISNFENTYKKDYSDSIILNRIQDTAYNAVQGGFPFEYERPEGNLLGLFRELNKLINSESLSECLSSFESEENFLKAIKNYYDYLMSIGKKEVGQGKYLHYHGDSNDWSLPEMIRRPMTDSHYSYPYAGKKYSVRPKMPESFEGLYDRQESEGSYSSGIDKFFHFNTTQMKTVNDFLSKNQVAKISLNIGRYNDILSKNNKIIEEHLNSKEEEFNSKKNEIKQVLPESLREDFSQDELSLENIKIPQLLEDEDHHVSIYFNPEELIETKKLAERKKFKESEEDGISSYEADRMNKETQRAVSKLKSYESSLDAFAEEMFSMSYRFMPQKDDRERRIVFYHQNKEVEFGSQLSNEQSYQVNIFNQIYDGTEKKSFYALQEKSDFLLKKIFDSFSDNFNNTVPSRDKGGVKKYNYPGVNIDSEKKDEDFYKYMFESLENEHAFIELTRFLNKEPHAYLKSITENHITHSSLDNLGSRDKTRTRNGNHNFLIIQDLYRKISKDENLTEVEKSNLYKELKKKSKEFDAFLSENFEKGYDKADGSRKRAMSDWRSGYNIYSSISDMFKVHLKKEFSENYLKNYIDKDFKIDYINLIKEIDKEIFEKIKKVNNISDLKELFSDKKYQLNIYTYLVSIQGKIDNIFNSYVNSLYENKSRSYHETVLSNSKELFDLESENKTAFFDDNNLVDLITSFDKECYTKTDDRYSMYKRDIFKRRYDFYKKSGFRELKDYHKKEDEDISYDSFNYVDDKEFKIRKKELVSKVYDYSEKINKIFFNFLKDFIDTILNFNLKEQLSKMKEGESKIIFSNLDEIGKIKEFNKIILIYITIKNKDIIKNIFKLYSDKENKKKGYTGFEFNDSAYIELCKYIEEFFSEYAENDSHVFAKKGDDRNFYCIKDENWISEERKRNVFYTAKYHPEPLDSYINTSVLLTKIKSDEQVSKIVENIKVFNQSLNDIVGDLIKAEESFLSSKFENKKIIFDFIKDSAVKKFAILAGRDSILVESNYDPDYDDTDDIPDDYSDLNWDYQHIKNDLYRSITGYDSSNSMKYGMLSFELIKYIKSIKFMKMLCFFVIGNKEDYNTKQKLCNFLLKDFKITNKREGINSDFQFSSTDDFSLRNMYLHKFITDCMNNITGSYLQRVNKALEIMSVYHNTVPESTYRGIFTQNRTHGYTARGGRIFDEENKKDDKFIEDIEYMSSKDCVETDYINLDVVRRLFKTYFSLKKLNATKTVEYMDDWGEYTTREKKFEVDIGEFIIIYIFEKFFPKETEDKFYELAKNGNDYERELYKKFKRPNFYTSLIPLETFYILLGLKPFELIEPKMDDSESYQNLTDEEPANSQEIYEQQLSYYNDQKKIYNDKKITIDNSIMEVIKSIENYYENKIKERYSSFSSYRKAFYLDSYDEEEDHPDWKDHPIRGNVKPISWAEAKEIELPKSFSEISLMYSSLEGFLNNFKLNYNDIHSDHDNILKTTKYIKKINYIASVINSMESFRQYSSDVQKKVDNLFDLNFRYKIEEGGSIGEYRFRVLEDLDPYHFQVGADTNCCQQIGLVGHVCAVDSFVNSHAGVVLLEKVNGDSVEFLISQSYFHYLEKENYIILDNVEFSSRISFLSPHYAILAKFLLEKGYNKVLCGKSYTKGDLKNGRFITNNEVHSPRKFVESGYNDYNSRDSLNLGKPKFSIPLHSIQGLEEDKDAEKNIEVKSLKEAYDIIENNNLLNQDLASKKDHIEDQISKLESKLNIYKNIESSKEIYYKVNAFDNRIISHFKNIKVENITLISHKYEKGSIITKEDFLNLINYLSLANLYDIKYFEKENGEIIIEKALPTRPLYSIVLYRFKNATIDDIDFSFDITPIKDDKNYLVEILTSKYKKYGLNTKRILTYLKRKISLKIKSKTDDLKVIDENIEYIQNQNLFIKDKSEGYLKDPAMVCDIYFRYIDKVEELESSIEESKDTIKYNLEHIKELEEQVAIYKGRINSGEGSRSRLRRLGQAIKQMDKEIYRMKSEIQSAKDKIVKEEKLISMYKEKNNHFLIHFNEENKDMLISEFSKRETEIQLKIDKIKKELDGEGELLKKFEDDVQKNLLKIEKYKRKKEEISDGVVDKKIIIIVDAIKHVQRQVDISRRAIRNTRKSMYELQDKLEVPNQEMEELKRFKSKMLQELETKIQKSSFINNLIIKRAAGVDNYFKLIKLSKWLKSKNLHNSNIIDLLY